MNEDDKARIIKDAYKDIPNKNIFNESPCPPHDFREFINTNSDYLLYCRKCGIHAENRA